MDDEQKDEANEFDEELDEKKILKGGSSILDDDIDDLDDTMPQEPEIADPLMLGDEDDTVSIDKVLDEEEAEDDDTMDDKDNEYGI